MVLTYANVVTAALLEPWQVTIMGLMLLTLLAVMLSVNWLEPALVDVVLLQAITMYFVKPVTPDCDGPVPVVVAVGFQIWLVVTAVGSAPEARLASATATDDDSEPLVTWPAGSVTPDGRAPVVTCVAGTVTPDGSEPASRLVVGT